MDKAQLDAIRARVEAASPPPWYVYSDGERQYSFPIYSGEKSVVHNASRPDAEFIAHAPNDIRALLVEVDALRAAVTECVEELNTTRTNERAIAIRALRALGMDDAQIKLWFAGEVIL